MGSSVSVMEESSLLIDFQNVAIVCHSSRVKGNIFDMENVALISELSDLFSENFHSSLNNAQSFIVCLDVNMQNSLHFLSILSHVKNSGKSIFATKLDAYFHPSGGCAAICKAYGQWFESFSLLASGLFGTGRVEIESFEELLKTSPGFESQQSAKHTINPTTDMCVSFTQSSVNGVSVADILLGLNVPNAGLNSSDLVFPQNTVKLDGVDLDADQTIIHSSHVLVFIISAETPTSQVQISHVRTALALGKSILPILCTGTTLTNWVAVTLAGNMYYEVNPLRPEDLFIPKYDSKPAVDLILAAQGMLSYASKPQHSWSEVEEEVIRRTVQSAVLLGVPQSTVDKILLEGTDILEPSDETREAESTEFDDTTNIILQPAITDTVDIGAQSFPFAVDLLPAVQTLPMNYIHYTKTRLNFSTALDILDDYCIPVVEKQLDCMFSYKWDSQAAIFDLYNQLSAPRVWFDILGSMQGNMNVAMASAVESVACMAVFVSESYQTSVNCKLELMYAVKCNKPLVFILLEGRETVIQPWLKEIMGDFDIYPLPPGAETQHPQSKYVVLDFTQQYIHGIPMPNAIAHIILKYVSWRAKLPIQPVRNSTLRVFNITSKLITAQHSALSTDNDGCGDNKSGKNKLVSCTRCETQYHPEAPYDGKCRKHRAYYMGGNILAGRWVCCNATDKTATGCEVADKHMSVPRIWYCDENYGTYTWSPE